MEVVSFDDLVKNAEHRNRTNDFPIRGIINKARELGIVYHVRSGLAGDGIIEHVYRTNFGEELVVTEFAGDKLSMEWNGVTYEEPTTTKRFIKVKGAYMFEKRGDSRERMGYTVY